MNNTKRHRLVAIMFVLLLAPRTARSAAEPTEPYNVIVLMTDEHNPPSSAVTETRL